MVFFFKWKQKNRKMKDFFEMQSMWDIRNHWACFLKCPCVPAFGYLWQYLTVQKIANRLFLTPLPCRQRTHWHVTERLYQLMLLGWMMARGRLCEGKATLTCCYSLSPPPRITLTFVPFCRSVNQAALSSELYSVFIQHLLRSYYLNTYVKIIGVAFTQCFSHRDFFSYFLICSRTPPSLYTHSFLLFISLTSHEVPCPLRNLCWNP